MKRLRIALLTHSTNPRGGVAYALSLGEALHDAGHDVTVFAPDATGFGFPRAVRCEVHSFKVDARRSASQSDNDPETPLLALVRKRVDEYVAHLESLHQTFDIYHAGDGISGNALAMLCERGDIAGFVRTVHHLDDFSNAELTRLQKRSVTKASQVICVSGVWARHLQNRYGLRAEVIFNGVDLRHFSPLPMVADSLVQDQFNVGRDPLFLSVGGIEARKNSVRILQAFALFCARYGPATLQFVGGATLLNHSLCQSSFADVMNELPHSTQRAVLRSGVVSAVELSALMRRADALVFPSLQEGFGLVVLEAMACGTPTVVSLLEPFTEYLGGRDCAWCDPTDIDSIASAMRHAIVNRDDFRERGLGVAARFPWTASALSHEAIYRSFLQENVHAADAVSGALAR